ncbi:aspartate kinase I [Fictibacillus macauensis ZFHKF-1]|uniref:Aspartokinase n=1 Tax=Fictibacillus macauensis ZFHKF-1 TaxID=1196324 RepID=I8AHE8_9BACL|nr:aspartate kinase [Fictibacillus macauensis]EIT85132.1 aspartate kinase I [Fictibacillus macauensis ZFHKF-1]
MKIIVQKFGGTSLKDSSSREMAAQHVVRAVKEGYKVVCVVSAMGRVGDPYATDTLLGLTKTSGQTLQSREYDLLLSCGEVISSVVFSNLLQSKSLTASAMTGAQAGFTTSNDHMNARITAMKCERLVQMLQEHDVIVVAGFQGENELGDTTTLGRGGSDTSASALGAALGAHFIDIFTDVEGVMTADPRIVKDARPLMAVTYNEICNMAYQGAKVIHPRAVEIAMQAKIPLRIRSTYSELPGTLVTAAVGKGGAGSDVAEHVITGIAHVPNVTQIKVTAQDSNYELHNNVFKAMAHEQISVDFFNISPKSIHYTVMGDKTAHAEDVLKRLDYQYEITPNCAKVSAVGAGMSGVPGVTSKIVAALVEEDIDILQSADSHTTIWVLVKQEDMVNAVNALHRVFDLNKKPSQPL